MSGCRWLGCSYTHAGDEPAHAGGDVLGRLAGECERSVVRVEAVLVGCGLMAGGVVGVKEVFVFAAVECILTYVAAVGRDAVIIDGGEAQKRAAAIDALLAPIAGGVGVEIVAVQLALEHYVDDAGGEVVARTCVGNHLNASDLLRRKVFQHLHQGILRYFRQFAIYPDDYVVLTHHGELTAAD